VKPDSHVAFSCGSCPSSVVGAVSGAVNDVVAGVAVLVVAVAPVAFIPVVGCPEDDAVAAVATVVAAAAVCVR